MNTCAFVHMQKDIREHGYKITHTHTGDSYRQQWRWRGTRLASSETVDRATDRHEKRGEVLLCN